MNLTARQRKLLYGFLIVVLTIPIIWLGRPATKDDPGGQLAGMRAEYKLGEASLGEIDPSSATMNLVLLGGVLAWFEAVLTLPGIAGVVLTVGMAVDANILVFERIKEEKSKGRSIAQAIETGYDRALVTIIDANLTTLITAYFLFQISALSEKLGKL